MSLALSLTHTQKRTRARAENYLTEFLQVELQRLHVHVEAQRGHGKQDVFPVDGLPLLLVAALARLRRDEADKFAHTLLDTLLRVFGDLRREVVNHLRCLSGYVSRTLAKPGEQNPDPHLPRLGDSVLHDAGHVSDGQIDVLLPEVLLDAAVVVVVQTLLCVVCMKHTVRTVTAGRVCGFSDAPHLLETGGHSDPAPCTRP